MKYKQSIIIDNIYLNLDRYYYETDEMFFYRVYFIIDYIKTKNNKKIDEIIGLSKLAMYKKFYKSDYNLSA